MFRHKKIGCLLLFFIFFVSCFLYLIPICVSITNENDIEFEFMQNWIYDEIPYNFTYDNESLNPTYYNNSDYLEHLNYFDEKYYDYLTTPYITDNVYDLDGSGVYYPLDLVHMKDYYILVTSHTYYNDLLIYQENFEFLYNVDNPIYDNDASNFHGSTTDGRNLYILSYVYSLSVYECFVLYFEDDLNFTLINSFILQDIGAGYYPRDIAFLNNSIYVALDHSHTDFKICQFDFNGNIINIYDSLTDITDYSASISYYNDLIYLVDLNDDDVHVYNIMLEHVKEYEREIHCLNSYIYNDMFFSWDYNDEYFPTGSDTSTFYVYNMTFEQENIYPEISYFPDNNGLFDSVNNVNISMNLNTNSIGYYNSSFGFDDDIIGLNPNNFIINEEGGNISVISQLDYHKKVLMIDDTSNTNELSIINEIDDVTNGTIEYYIQSNDTTKNSGFSALQNDVFIFSLSYFNNYLWYWDGMWHTSGVSVSSNEWIRISISFECTSNLYYDLNQYHWCFYINDVRYGNYSFGSNVSYIDAIQYRVLDSAVAKTYIDAIGYSWDYNYNINDNLYYDIDNAFFHNAIIFLSENNEEIINIECNSGAYYINYTDINYNIYFSNESYIYDNWTVNIIIEQEYQNGSIYFYNESNDLLFEYTFSCNISDNIKFIKYKQYYTNSFYYIYVNNVIVYSNSTAISGNNGFVSYEMNIPLWSTEYSKIQINGYGRYRLWLFNDSYYENCSMLQISSWFTVYDISMIELYIQNNIEFPYLIVESLNGIYLFGNILIYRVSQDCLLSDSRGYIYVGNFNSLNVNVTQSYFEVIDNYLYFEMYCDDSNEEYIELSFDIINVNNENYQMLYSTYLNTSYLENCYIRLQNSDLSSTILYISQYYDSNVEILNQDKITSKIYFHISDDDMLLNNTIAGYIESFIFNYAESILIDIFIEYMLIGLIPIIIIIAISFTIAYVFRKNEKDIVNKDLFFPIFLIVSFIVFIFGFFDLWVMFSIVISGVSYSVYKSESGA